MRTGVVTSRGPWGLLPVHEVVDQLHNPRKSLLFAKNLLRVVLQLCDATNLSCRYVQLS